MGDVDHKGPYQLIGSRPGSPFRVPGDYFQSKARFQPGIDPISGGPCTVVYRGTDLPVSGATIDDGGRIQFSSELRPDDDQ